MTIPRRLIALVQLAVFLPACTSWQVEPATPAELLGKRPSMVRLTTSDSSRVVLLDPEVRGDTLYGHRQLPDQSRAEQPEAIALAQVQEIAILRSDPTKTTLLVTGIAVATFSTLCFLGDAFGCGPDYSTVPLFGTE
jgi:hypothetical protein